MKFKEGDKVILTATRHGIDGSNPVYGKYRKNVVGVIYDINNSSSFPVMVNWSNGTTNCYYEKDLNLYIPKTADEFNKLYNK